VSNGRMMITAFTWTRHYVICR